MDIGLAATNFKVAFKCSFMWSEVSHEVEQIWAICIDVLVVGVELALMGMVVMEMAGNC